MQRYGSSDISIPSTRGARRFCLRRNMGLTGTGPLRVMESHNLAVTANLWFQSQSMIMTVKRVPKGGYEEHRSLVFVGIPPVASRGTSCSWMFAVVRLWLLAFLSTFLSGVHLCHLILLVQLAFLRDYATSSFANFTVSTLIVTTCPISRTIYCSSSSWVWPL